MPTYEFRCPDGHVFDKFYLGNISGGTVASMMDLLEHLGDPAVRRALADPYVLVPEGESASPQVDTLLEALWAAARAEWR